MFVWTKIYKQTIGIFLAFAWCATTGSAQSQVMERTDGAPDLAAWIEETRHVTGEYPRTIAFLTSLPVKGKGQAKFLNIDAAGFNKLGYFKTVSADSIDWDYKLNREALQDLDPFAAVLKMTRADTVVLASAKGPWRFIRASNKGRTVVLTAKRPKSTKPAALVAWLTSILGWDGVVIDQKDDFLLVGSTTQILRQAEIQALTIEDSDTKFKVTVAERKGTGLLSLSETRDGLGVFDIVLLGEGVKSIRPGTKLIIEKKK